MEESRASAAPPSAEERGVDPSGERPAPGVSHLLDPWSRRGMVPLDGFMERGGGGIWPWAMALLVLVGTFFAFNLIGEVVRLGVFAAQGASLQIEPGMDLVELARQIPPDITVISNSVGQVLGLGLPIFGLAWLHSSRVAAFLRLRRVPWQAVLLALVGMGALLPVIGWLGELNQMLPLPDFVQQLEDMRMETIYRVLESDLGLAVTLVALAVVPAVCEELAFRGYAQRQFERSAGTVGGIVLTGVLFGVYHVSFAQVLPLSVLGVYLAYLTWRTGSLWPAILVHFANNAFSIVGARLAVSRPDLTLADVEAASWPWPTVVGGLILCGVVLFFLHTRAPRWQPSRES